MQAPVLIYMLKRKYGIVQTLSAEAAIELLLYEINYGSVLP